MPKRQNTTVGRAVRSARLAQRRKGKDGKDRPMTLANLSEETGLSPQFLSDLEHDRRGADPGNLILIAKALGAPAERFLRLGMVAKTSEFQEALDQLAEERIAS